MANFALNVAAFAKKAGDRADLIVRKVVLDIGTRIVERSPVGNPELWAINRNRGTKKLRAPPGYVGGRFRANWQYGNYSGAGVPMGVLDEVDPTGEKTIGRMAARIPTSGAAGMRHIIKNSLPYAMPLENGWSKQAPAGMVGLTVVEFESIVNEAVQVAKST